MGVRATRLRRLRIRKAIGHTTLAVGLFAAGMVFLSLEKNVTLVVDGHPRAVRTLSGSVGQLLAVQGIALDPGDLVEPPLATALADGMTVTVSLDVVAAPAQQDPGVGVWAVEGVSGPFAKLAVQPTENVFSADSSVGPSRIVDARVVVRGKEHDVLTNAATVRELLSAMGIRPDGNDRVLPPPSTPLHAGSLVRYVDVELGSQEIEQPIAFGTLTTYSSALPPGAVRVTRAGTPGRVLQTFRVRTVDGKVVARTLMSELVLARPVAEERVVGQASAGASVVGGHTETGEASWYEAPGSGFTAASPWLPFGTRVRVTNLATGGSVTVVINDRGPFGGRIIDLSSEAFAAIAPLGQGVVEVRLTW